MPTWGQCPPFGKCTQLAGIIWSLYDSKNSDCNQITIEQLENGVLEDKLY